MAAAVVAAAAAMAVAAADTAAVAAADMATAIAARDATNPTLAHRVDWTRVKPFLFDERREQVASGRRRDHSPATIAQRARVALHEKPGPRLVPASATHKVVMGLAVGLPFVGCIAAAALLWQWGFMGWLYVGMLVGGWFFTGSGITVGFHRLLTHRSFETYSAIRWFWMALGALSVEGSPLVWCAIHRRHHELSDRPGDPHSPHLHGAGFLNMLRGLWHA